MATKIIVSYDGTANEDDAIALGRVFAGAGAEVALAYVRHNEETVSDAEAKELLARGAELFGDPGVDTFFVTPTSTPEGWRRSRRPGLRGDRVLLGLAHGQGSRRRGQLGPAADRGRLLCGRGRARGLRRARPDQPLGTSLRSATATVVRVRRRPRWRPRWAPRWHWSSTTTRACWCSTRGRSPSPGRSRSARRPAT